MTTLIADCGQHHMGDIGLAFKYVDMLADCGVDVAKFQVHYPEDQPSRAEYWAKTGFSDREWVEIAAYTRSKDLEFCASPFSVRAVDLLEKIGQPFWKIASGQVTNIEMLKAIPDDGKNVLISDGLGTPEEIEVAEDSLDCSHLTYHMTCASSYPSKPEEIKHTRWSSEGTSDHSGTIWPSIYALAHSCNGGTYIEFHCIFDKSEDTPDAQSSLDPAQIKQVVEAREFFQKMGTEEYVPSEEMRSKYLYVKQSNGNPV